MNVIDVAIVVYLLIGVPAGIYIFAGKKVDKDGVGAMWDRYKWHILMLFFLFVFKTFIFLLEPPFEARFGVDFTPTVYTFEGDAVLHVQTALLSPYMTLFAAVVYIGSFLFIYVFSFILFAYVDRFKLCSSLMFLNLLLLLISIPFYFFVIVYTPSYPFDHALVPGIKPLLYEYHPAVREFFYSYDTFNNCFPSMHIGYPAAILFIIMMQERRFVKYKAFLVVMTALISLSIVYLGIHWLIDIAAGFAVAAFAAVLADRWAKPFWKCLFVAVKMEWKEEDWK